MINNFEEILIKLMSLDELLNDDSKVDNEVNRELVELEKLLESVTDKKSKLDVKIKKLNSLAVIPSYSKEGDAGLDLTVTEIKKDTEHKITYGFGISMEIPKGYVGLVFPRSSIRDTNLTLSNCVGIIDSGYRGEIMGTFYKLKINKIYNVGDRAAQILILPYPTINFIERDELSETERGSGGFGHTN